MPQKLEQLEIREVSLVDRPANSEFGIPRARIALFKRDSSEEDYVSKAIFESLNKDGKTYDGVSFPKSDFAYTPTDIPSDWKLRLTKVPGGAPDAGIIGAAVAALGKGFRGKKVEIPASALASVKAKVRAAWKKANSDKGADALPDILKQQGETQMTLIEIEKRQEEQDKLLTLQKAEIDFLKSENELVTKMSKKERELFATMDTEKRKAFVAADTEKRKGMMEDCDQEKKEKAAEDSMDDATKAEFAKAGPNRRLVMLAKAEAKGKAPKDEEDDVDSEDEEEMDEESNKKQKALTMKMASMETELAKSREAIAKSQDEIAKSQTKLADIEKAQRVSHFTKRAEVELPNTSGSPAQKGETLMKMADALGGENSEAFKSIFKTMQEADKVLAKNFVEVGKLGGPIPALQAFDAKVAEISKRDSVDNAHAIDKAMQEHPELYMEYEKQQRAVVHAF